MNDEAKYNWQGGNPPHIGWWLTKDRNGIQRWCWWDGNFFLYHAQAKGNLTWSDYYPEGARVPRVDPALRANIGIINAINMTPMSEVDGDWWARKAWHMYHGRQMLADAAAVGSTPTVQAMKDRMVKPLPAAVKAEWNKWAQATPPVPPGYVAGSRQRLSDAVRIGDADFSGAMQRNTDPGIPTYQRRGDTEGVGHAHLRSTGQVQPPQNPEPREIGDPFHGVSTIALMRELFRRFNAKP